jgi:hypothetical protein
MLWIVNRHENGEHLSLEQMRALLEGNEEVGFEAPNRRELYAWTQATLCAQGYMSLHRSGKGYCQIGTPNHPGGAREMLCCPRLTLTYQHVNGQ